MKKSHKAEFINKHGEEMWKLCLDYTHGDRSPEATNANKLYHRITHGRLKEEYTVYGILENDRLIYIGCTSTDVNVRWNNHKNRARTLKFARPLHCHMNTVSSNHDIFPEFNIVTFHVFDDEHNAKIVEKSLIMAHKTNTNGFNKNIGGGSKSILKRPISQPDDLQTR